MQNLQSPPTSTTQSVGSFFHLTSSCPTENKIINLLRENIIKSDCYFKDKYREQGRIKL